MITLDEAIALATEAHAGQWRRPRPATPDECAKFSGSPTYPLYLGDGTEIYKQVGEPVMAKEPYVNHPLAVMEMMGTEEEKIVAVLHDVLENTNVTATALTIYGYSYTIVKAVIRLTKEPNQDYYSYLQRVITDPIARKVKLADVFDNMQGNLSENQKAKYPKALPILLKSI